MSIQLQQYTVSTERICEVLSVALSKTKIVDFASIVTNSEILKGVSRQSLLPYVDVNFDKHNTNADQQFIISIGSDKYFLNCRFDQNHTISDVKLNFSRTFTNS